MLLAGWLSARSTGLGDATTLSTDLKLRTLRPISPGETLLEIRSGGLLTPAVAYADREFGRDISSYAAQLGVGFGSVALATYLTAERVRGFGAATWFAGSSAETGGSISASSTLRSQCHWSLKAPVVDPDVRPLVTRGIELVLPLCELAARRAWSSRQVWVKTPPAVLAAARRWMMLHSGLEMNWCSSSKKASRSSSHGNGLSRHLALQKMVSASSTIPLARALPISYRVHGDLEHPLQADRAAAANPGVSAPRERGRL